MADTQHHNHIQGVLDISSSVSFGNGPAPRPPNGLAFSCRERAWASPQNSDDLAREAVSCNAVFGGNAVEIVSSFDRVRLLFGYSQVKLLSIASTAGCTMLLTRISTGI